MKAQGIKISGIFGLFLLTILYIFFLSYSLILFNSCSYCITFNSTAELIIPIGVPTKEEKVEIETDQVNAQAKISKCSM